MERILINIINSAEHNSERTCELCGCYGYLQEKRLENKQLYVKTICDKCAKKEKYKPIKDLNR